MNFVYREKIKINFHLDDIEIDIYWHFVTLSLYIHPSVSAQPRKPVLMRLSKKYFISPMSFSWNKQSYQEFYIQFLPWEVDQS